MEKEIACTSANGCWDLVDHYLTPIKPLFEIPGVTEIMVNGPDLTFVERNGKLTVDESIKFIDSDHVRRVIDKIVAQVGRRIDESQPLCDARLPDGSRVNAVISPLSIRLMMTFRIRSRFSSRSRMMRGRRARVADIPRSVGLLIIDPRFDSPAGSVQAPAARL